ncbi:MAG: hypothetical protein EAZ24_16135, partial [Burkholderiales bacterium]
IAREAGLEPLADAIINDASIAPEERAADFVDAEKGVADTAAALDGARALGVSLPHTASVAQMMNACVAQDGANWDHSALIKVLETASNFSLDSVHL